MYFSLKIGDSREGVPQFRTIRFPRRTRDFSKDLGVLLSTPRPLAWKIHGGAVKVSTMVFWRPWRHDKARNVASIGRFQRGLLGGGSWALLDRPIGRRDCKPGHPVERVLWWGCVTAIAYRWTRLSNKLRELFRLAPLTGVTRGRPGAEHSTAPAWPCWIAEEAELGSSWRLPWRSRHPESCSRSCRCSRTGH